MSNGGGTTGEEEKIILNGGVAEKLLGETCYTIKRHLDAGRHFPNARKLVVIANALEDLANLFQREVLDQIGFKGPYPHALNRCIEEIKVGENGISVRIRPAS